MAARKTAGDAAVRRGRYYAKVFTREEVAELDNLQDEGLESEIALLRVVIRRFMRLVEAEEDTQALQGHLEAISRAAGRLANVLRVHHSLGGKSPTQLAFFEALEEVNRELGLKKPGT